MHGASFCVYIYMYMCFIIHSGSIDAARIFRRNAVCDFVLQCTARNEISALVDLIQKREKETKIQPTPCVESRERERERDLFFGSSASVIRVGRNYAPIMFYSAGVVVTPAAAAAAATIGFSFQRQSRARFFFFLNARKFSSYGKRGRSMPPSIYGVISLIYLRRSGPGDRLYSLIWKLILGSGCVCVCFWSFRSAFLDT